MRRSASQFGRWLAYTFLRLCGGKLVEQGPSAAKVGSVATALPSERIDSEACQALPAARPYIDATADRLHDFLEACRWLPRNDPHATPEVAMHLVKSANTGTKLTGSLAAQAQFLAALRLQP